MRFLAGQNFFTCRTRRQGSTVGDCDALSSRPKLLHLPHKAAGVGWRATRQGGCWYRAYLGFIQIASRIRQNEQRFAKVVSQSTWQPSGWESVVPNILTAISNAQLDDPMSFMAKTWS